MWAGGVYFLCCVSASDLLLNGPNKMFDTPPKTSRLSRLFLPTVDRGSRGNGSRVATSGVSTPIKLATANVGTLHVSKLKCKAELTPRIQILEGMLFESEVDIVGVQEGRIFADQRRSGCHVSFTR